MVTLETDQQVRAEVARRLRRSAIPDSIWELCGDDEVLRRIRQAKETDRPRLMAALVDDVGNAIERALGLADELRDDGSRRETAATAADAAPFPVSISESIAAGLRPGGYEHDRARAFAAKVAEAVEAWGAYDPAVDLWEPSDARSHVRAFREDMLGGVLDPERAVAFARSPAARFLSVGTLASAAVPAASLSVEVESEERWRAPDGRLHEKLRLRIAPPGALPGGDRVERFRFTPSTSTSALPSITLPVGGGGRYEPVPYWTRTVLHELQRLATRLARHFPWGQQAMAWFVLTGDPPILPPLEAGYSAAFGRPWERAVITLEVEPWVPAATVEHLYGELRRRALPSDPRWAKALAVWHFARDHERGTGRPLRGEPLREAWNAANPEDRYKHREPIARARKRGEELVASIVSPGYEPSIGAGALEPIGLERVDTPSTTPSLPQNPRTAVDGAGRGSRENGG